MKNFSAIIVISFLFTACVKDKPAPAPEPVPAPEPASRVYVLNEGNFGSGNASVSLYDPATSGVVKDHYFAQNNSQLGDVAQSMTRIGDQYYIVVNNSGKIVVCDRNLKKTREITGLNSPRYIFRVHETKAYVSDLTASVIHIIHPLTGQKTGEISCPGWTETMVMSGDEVFVTNQRRNYVYVINSETDQITDSVFAGPFAGSQVFDRNNKLWVLSQGDALASVPGRLSRINPVTRQPELVLNFSAAEFPSALCINKGGDTLYFLNQGVCRLPVAAASLPSAPLVAAGTRMFYGLALAPSGEIYVSDALDYIQNSMVYVYDRQGVQKTFFRAGIISNNFYFE